MFKYTASLQCNSAILHGGTAETVGQKQMTRSYSRLKGAATLKATLLATLSFGLPLGAFSQAEPPPPPPKAQSFTPDYFERFAPRTAADMVTQIPGFQTNDNNNNNDSRGFGQAQENILINGQRVSSKSTSALDALARIPAANVVQIEILDGAKLDIPGLSGQVVNVIAKSSGISGAWSYSQLYREHMSPALDIFDVSLSGEKGDVQWTVSLANDVNLRSNAGRDNITDGAGILDEYRTETETASFTTLELAGTLTWTPSNGHIANLNAKIAEFTKVEAESSNRFSPTDVEFARVKLGEREEQWDSEFSGDYEFGFGPGQLKLIGLQRNEHSPVVKTAFGGNLDGTNLSSEIFDQTVDESESILRSEYNWSTAPGRNWQLSLEGALNTLESESLRSTAMDLTTTPVAQPLPNPNVKVEEERIEAFITHGRQINPSVRLQTSLGAEVSEIASSGENGQTRTFTRPKGSISANWQVNDKLTLNTTLERTVGQLDFFDFVSSVDLDLGEDDVGNIDIVPEQSWRLEVEAESNFDAWGALTAQVFAESLEDINDQVPIQTGVDPITNLPTFGEGPGNLDSGSRIGASIDGTLKFDPLGLKGAQFDYYLYLTDSSVDDPLTGQSRQFNRDRIIRQAYEFRHDIQDTDYAWGLAYQYNESSLAYRRNATTFNGESPGTLAIFFVHKDIFGLTGTINVHNINDQDRVTRRVSYSPDRTGDISRIEDRARNYGNVLTLTLEGAF